LTMATLISLRTSDGHRRRCTARCYCAKGPQCDCICGGMNHGAGPQRAALNTESLSEEEVVKLQRQLDQRQASRLEKASAQLSLQF